MTTFHCVKPFYIAPATEREMEGCVCIRCLNPHELFKVLKKYVPDLPHSLTEYLTLFFSCSWDHDINFPCLGCIRGTCKNYCQITNDSKKNLNWEELVTYSQYERVDEQYYDRQGNLKAYTRTTKKDYNVYYGLIIARISS